MYLVFARKYRPNRFEELVGQQHIASTLQNAVKNDRVAHSYLFCGSRGVGKTTMARLLAKALQCENGPTPEPCCECDPCKRIATGDFIDVMEIDGASNRGIEEIRELRQHVQYSPARSRFKVYYIDEVHMLTPPAFNALLKTLEEPPGHVKFIFSTTDPQQMPETIKSRCQRFDFRRISDAEIVAQLEMVCQKEQIEAEKGTLRIIARAARGSMRDALSTLDQVASFSGGALSSEQVLEVLGAVESQALAQIVDALGEEDTGSVLHALHELLFKGTDVEDFCDQLSEYLRDLLVARYCKGDDEILAGAVADSETLERQSRLFSENQLCYMMQLIREAKLRARRETTGRLALELAVIKMSRLSRLVELDDALHQLPEEPSAAGTEASDDTPGSDVPAVVREIKSRLKKRPQPTPKVKEDPPRQDSGSTLPALRDCAENESVAREAGQDELLQRTFAEAQSSLGLRPMRLVRRPDAEKEADDEEEDGLPEEQ